jgi:V/A-type H+-transporting ATPase subunit B
LTELDKKYLEFADEFERKFISQGNEDRNIETTFAIAWDLFSMLPEEELKRIKLDYVQKYHPVYKGKSRGTS